jgi:hypothetical protein
MTNHAVLVFRGKRGKFGFLLVADVALFFQGPIGIKRIEPILWRKLCMWRVTFDAVLIALILYNFLGTVYSLIEILQNVIMTCQAVLRIKKVRRLLVNIGRIGVLWAIVDICVAVMARILSMDRGMKFLAIDKPGRLDAWSPKDGRQKK